MQTILSRPQPETRTAPRAATAAPVSKGRLRTGRAMSALVVLFLLFDAGIKLLRLAPAVEGTVQLGYPEAAVLPLGVVLLACIVLYVVPRTSVLGAVLLTGYLGGAIATHVRLGSPLLSHTLFPVYVALLAWGGLYLRDPGVRALLPLRR